MKELLASLKQNGYNLARKTSKTIIFEKRTGFDSLEDNLTTGELDALEPVLKSYSDRLQRHVAIKLYLRKPKGKPILTLYLLHRKETQRIHAFSELKKSVD